MDKITAFSKATNAALSAECLAELKAVADKHGLTVKSWGWKTTLERADLVFRFEAEPVTITTASGAVVKEATDLGKQAADQYGLSLEPNAAGERLVDYRPSARKYPFTFEDKYGKRWSAPLASVQAKFGKPKPPRPVPPPIKPLFPPLVTGVPEPAFKEPVVSTTRGISDMSDEELLAALKLSEPEPAKAPAKPARVYESDF